MTEITVYNRDSWYVNILQRLATLVCTHIVTTVPKNETEWPVVYKLCELFLGVNEERTVNLVELSDVWKTVLVVLYCVTFAVGILGNVSVLIILLVNKDIRFVTSAFLASLAVSDLVTIFFAIPSHLVSLLSQTWNLLGNFNVGAFACKAVTYMEACGAAANILTIVGLASERYFAVLHPLKTRTLQNGKRIGFILAAIWVLALVVSVPVPVYYQLASVLLWNIPIPPNNLTGSQEAYLFDTTLYDDAGETTIQAASDMFTCVVPQTDYGSWMIYRWCHLALLFLAPVFIMTFCYYKIGQRLLKRKEQVSNHTPIVPRSADISLRMRKKTAHRVILVLTCAVVSFIICWAPTVFFETLVVTMDIRLTETTLTVRYIFEWLAVSTCAHNPILYTLLHEKFRKTLVNKLFTKKRGNKIYPGDASPGISGMKSSTKESSDADILTSSGEGPTLLISVYKEREKKYKECKEKRRNKKEKLINVEDLPDDLYHIRPRSMTFA